MVSFRQRTAPASFLGRREQRRLLLLVLLLGLVIFMMREARDPRRWEWMWRLGEARQTMSNAAAGPGRSVAVGPTSDDAIDTRLKPAEPAADGAILVAPVEPSEEVRAELFTGVSVELLDRVCDDTPFRGAEHETWFHLLEILQAADPQELAAASIGTVDFAQLFQQSHEYRGEVVTVRGTVRQALRVEAPKNELGLDGYYQLTLQPLGYQASPIILYSLVLPAEFPLGSNLSADINANGFFFKRWAYPASDAIRLAPVVLAATVDWTRPVAIAPAIRTGTRSAWIGAGVSAIVLITLFFVGRRWLTTKPIHTASTVPDLSSLEGVEDTTRLFSAEPSSPPGGDEP